MSMVCEGIQSLVGKAVLTRLLDGGPLTVSAYEEDGVMILLIDDMAGSGLTEHKLGSVANVSHPLDNVSHTA